MNKEEAIEYWRTLWNRSCSADQRDWYAAGYWNGLIEQFRPTPRSQQPEWYMGYEDAQGDWSDS